MTVDWPRSSLLMSPSCDPKPSFILGCLVHLGRRTEVLVVCLGWDRITVSLCLSCSYGDHVQHFKVLQDRCGQYYVWDERFSSLNELVEFYHGNSIAKERNVFLMDPKHFARVRTWDRSTLVQTKKRGGSWSQIGSHCCIKWVRALDSNMFFFLFVQVCIKTLCSFVFNAIGLKQRGHLASIKTLVYC